MTLPTGICITNPSLDSEQLVLRNFNIHQLPGRVRIPHIPFYIFGQF